MSVQSIVEAANSQLGILLPSYKPLDYVWFPEKNNFYNNSKRYGVSVSSANQIYNVVCAFSLTQNFNVILSDSYKATDQDDKDIMNRVFELSNDLQDALIKFYQTKLGLTNLILQVNPISIDAPIIIENSQLIILNSTIAVQYRYNIT